MLKIKDNVDLKELEKFGFELDEDLEAWVFRNDVSDEILAVQTGNKYIYFELWKIGFAGAIVEDLLFKLFDIIKAGLVEKVVEE